MASAALSSNLTRNMARSAPPWASFRVASLAWADASDDDRRFWRIATVVLVLALALGVVVPLLPLQPQARVESQALPAPLTKLLLERDVAVPAPPPQPAPTLAKDAAKDVPKDAPKDSATPAAKEPSKVTPKPTAANDPRAVTVVPTTPADARPSAEVALDNARRTASSVGLLALKDQLADIANAPAAAQIKQDLPTTATVGTGAGTGVGAGSDPGLPARAIITSNATKGSGGISSGVSTSSGGTGAAGTLAQGGGLAAGLGTRGGSTAVVAKASTANAGTNNDVQKGNGSAGKASRSIEDVKLVFDRNKGAIYAIYNRALRDDPALQGKVVLELKISPSGQVDALRIVSSELKAEELERKLLARIRQFDFGAKDVEALVVTWPVDFLPS
jgi:periplasmic protein TonB